MKQPRHLSRRMREFMSDSEHTRAHLDDLLVISKGTFEKHLQYIEKVLSRLSETRLKVNVSKSSFCKTELKHLGFLMTRKRI